MKIVSLFSLGLLVACGAPASTATTPTAAPTAAPVAPPQPPEPAEPEPLSSNKKCVTGTVVCENGVCKASVKNNCDKAVACEFLVTALCKGKTDSRQAKGKDRGTIPQGQSLEFAAGGNCEGARVVGTTPDGIKCS